MKTANVKHLKVLKALRAKTAGVHQPVTAAQILPVLDDMILNLEDEGGEKTQRLGIVPVPRVLPRLVRLPGGAHDYVTLADLAEQFERWRQSRATGQERIPPSLWDQAVALSTVLPCSRVARRLRVRSTDLRKRGLAGPAAVATEVAGPIPDFVEVTAPWLGSAAPGAAAGWRGRHRV